jgi:hypothetical protein
MLTAFLAVAAVCLLLAVLAARSRERQDAALRLLIRRSSLSDERATELLLNLLAGAGTFRRNPDRH